MNHADFDSRAQTEWAWVRANIYPEWDPGEEWRLARAEEYERLPYPESIKSSVTGLCSTEEKMVWLNPRRVHCLDRDRIRAVLIHEIGHFFVNGHDHYFQEVMEIALRQVEQVGSKRLALMLASDIDYCRTFFSFEDYRTLEESVYASIIRCVHFHPFFTFSEICQIVFDGLFPPYFIRRRFRRAVYWYRKERRRARKEFAAKAPRMQAAGSGEAIND